LVLKAGKKAFKSSSLKNAFEADSPLAKGTYRNLFDHKVMCRIFDKTQAIKGVVNDLANAKVVLIVRNIDPKNPETRREIYGFDSGLEMAELTAPSTDGDGIV
ncbi:MAG: hypothetical protein RR960_07835, partial [Alistipes sp.]